MKHLFTLLFCFVLVAGLSAQTLGDYKIKEAAKTKRMAKKDKRVYIADFQVNYQLGLALQDEKTGGRMFGGGVKGNTSASLVVGLTGINEEDLQNMTNKFYEDYINDLKSQGFEIVGPEEFFEQKSVLKKRDKRWQIKTYNDGPKAGNNFGSIVTRPQGFKTVAPLVEVNSANPVQNMKTMYIAQTEMKVEQEADFIMNRVFLNIQAFENSQGAASKMISRMSKTATVKAETNFRVSGQWSKNTFNMYSTYTSSDIPINGVIEKQKFNVQTVADRDSWGTNIGAFKVFKADNRSYENVKTVKCEPEKYLKGAEMGGTAFLKETLKMFYTAFK